MRSAFVITILLFAFSANAQDIIVRVTGDTINAKIESQNEAFLYYFDHHSKAKDIQVISRKEVLEVIYNFETIDFKRRRPNRLRNYDVVHLSMQYTGYYINNTEMVIHRGIDGYYEKLQFATGLYARADFFFDEFFGVGGMYALAKSSNSVGYVLTPWGVFGKLADEISINYYGIHAVMRYRLGDSQADVLLSLGMGYQTFRNNGKIVYDYKLNGYDFGFHGSGQFNLFLGDGIYVSVSLGYIGRDIGNLSGDFKNMPKEIEEDLNYVVKNMPKINTERIFIGAGLTFAF